MEVFEVYTTVPGLFVVEPRKCFCAHLELDRDHALLCHEHRIDAPAEPRDVELEVDPRGGGGRWRGDQFLEGRTKDGQLQPPGRLLLRGERVAMRARERRVDLLLARGEKLLHRRGVEGGIGAWAWHGR